MDLVDAGSLAATLSNLNLALLQGKALARAEREELAEWLAGRVAQPGSYRGMPAPTPRDYASACVLFTGEPVTSRAGKACKLGFEATWALAVLGPRRAAAAAAAARCQERALECFAQERRRRRGMYCCYSCSVVGWRALAASSLPAAEPLRRAAMDCLSAARAGNGRWERFPFWYTVLALTGMETPAARAELRYAAPICKQYLRRPHGERCRLVAAHAVELAS